ncbi:armadillo-type protein [Absidia repens]|uniref:Armadillo-type protein n=1 Tax=Absidia repens TaxID=90262 RepID=A0A1X2IY79_9FUNG|nr:armadillo-type protein [Absidia repens]
MVAHGGIDALIWLCRTSTNTEIHHLVTTNLAMLAEKESIRPVIITKWALPPLLQLLRHYIHDRQNVNGINDKKLPTASIASASPSSTGTHSSSTETVTKQLTVEDIDHYTVYLEIIINCTHVIYQLAKAGILSQEEIITDGVLETLFSLTMYKMDSPVDRTTSDDSFPLTEKQHEQNMKGIGSDYQEQWKERESVIQGLAAKSISFISSTVSNQASVIEQLRNSNKLMLAVTSKNDEVKKYIAKTVAYLSLRNDKYKPILLGNGKVRSLLSVLVLLPQTGPNFDDSNDLRQSDIAYYLSSSDKGEQDSRPPYTAAVSHICCALANFATNQESQVILMAQPRLLQYICNVPSLFPSHLETHRHVARCLANLALYDENKDKMLATTNLRRHIIRAIDNLSGHGKNSTDGQKTTQFWKSNYQNIKPLIDGIMALTDEEDTLKRAKSILEPQQDDSNTNATNQDEAQQDDSTETEHQESGPPKGKSNKKNKKKKKNS